MVLGDDSLAYVALDGSGVMTEADVWQPVFPAQTSLRRYSPQANRQYEHMYGNIAQFIVRMNRVGAVASFRACSDGQGATLEPLKTRLGMVVPGLTHNPRSGPDLVWGRRACP